MGEGRGAELVDPVAYHQGTGAVDDHVEATLQQVREIVSEHLVQSPRDIIEGDPVFEGDVAPNIHLDHRTVAIRAFQPVGKVAVDACHRAGAGPLRCSDP